jgi:purine-cytosine permease-like protein
MTAETHHHTHIDNDELEESIEHDYSTSESGIVPLDRRRPRWHFSGLWMTFSAGFSFLFVGTAIHDGGHSLASTIEIVAVGIAAYLAYAMVGAVLGSMTGQTHALLTRSIFGIGGSGLVSIFAFVGALGFVGFQANLLVQVWDGLFSWGHLELLTIVLSAAMIINNVFGFTGISAYARYLVTPMLVLWVYFLLIKGIATDGGQLGGTPKGDMGFFPAVGLVIGFCMWGNEPDVWRYGKPSFRWPLPSFVFGLVGGFAACAIGGWFMAELAGSTEFGKVVDFTTNYSLFGVGALTFILATVTQVAINDGNYYEVINAMQNLLGDWKRWSRMYTCAVCAVAGGLAGWLVNFVITDGFTKVSAFLPITVPCATVIMAVDHFLLPRIFRISRPLVKVPTWSEAAPLNYPAFAALVIAVIFGAFGTGIMPGADASRYWAIAPLEAWILAGVLYLGFVAVVRAAAPAKVKSLLGFSQPALEMSTPDDQIINVASHPHLAIPAPTPVAEPVPAGAGA